MLGVAESHQFSPEQRRLKVLMVAAALHKGSRGQCLSLDPVTATREQRSGTELC